jgi:hypothetical protein
MRIIVCVALLLLVVGAVPNWPYSPDWGYYPVGAATVLLLALFVILFKNVENRSVAPSRSAGPSTH